MDFMQNDRSSWNSWVGIFSGGEVVEVDESLFQDLDDLNFDDGADDDEDVQKLVLADDDDGSWPLQSFDASDAVRSPLHNGFRTSEDFSDVHHRESEKQTVQRDKLWFKHFIKNFVLMPIAVDENKRA